MSKKGNGKVLIEITQEQAVILAGLAKWTSAWLEGNPIGAFFKQSEIDAEDKRPDPKPRKLALLWQTYLAWHEFMELRKRHRLRALSILRKKSEMNLAFESEVIAVADYLCERYRKEMIKVASREAGEIWEHLISIKGLKEGGLAAQLIAQIDDIGKFDTVSKLWAHSVGKIDEDWGRMYRAKRGEKSPVNKNLAAIGYLVSDQFVRQRTYPYRDFYDGEKVRLRELHPEPVKAIKGENVPKGYPWKYLYTDSHIDRMARRATFKRFLRDLWLTWRKIEGLPISDRYEDRDLDEGEELAPAA